VAALCTVAVVARAQPPADQVSVPLSDPARPATLTVQAVEGGITVRGSNRLDVLVIARDRARHQRNQGGGGTGLRQLAQPPAFTIQEARNRISIAVQTTIRVIDFEIQVPSRTDLKLATANNGGIVVEGVEGELEINNPNGAITLNRVGGSIVANSVNDHVKATVTSLSMQKPMAFTSLNGHVDVTFPASLKANLKLRSDNGNVLTDFEVTPLQQPTTVEDTRRRGGRFRIQISPTARVCGRLSRPA
jgi:putative adhesin